MGIAHLEAQDELLSWHRCGACAHVFLPPSTPVSACPSCAATHMLDAHLLGWDERTPARSVHTWLVAHGWPGFYHLCEHGRRDFYFLGDRRAIVPQAAAVHLAKTQRLLEERGEVRGPMGAEPYVVFWLAQAWTQPSSADALAQANDLWRQRVGSLPLPEQSEEGLQVRITGADVSIADRVGAARVAEALAGVAHALGGHGFHRLAPSDTPGAWPASARSARSMGCGHCGAPLAPGALLSNGTACPYCLGHVEPPAALRAEVQGYARRLAALDARWTFRPAVFFERLGAHDPAKVIACPACGAPAERQPRSAAQECRHCGSGVVPPADVMSGEIAAAQARADAGQRASARKLSRRQRSQQQGPILAVLVVTAMIVAMNLSIVPLLIFGGWLDAFAHSRGIPAVPLKTWACGISGGLVFLLMMTVGLGALIYRLRNARERRRWRPIAARVAEQFNTQATDLVDAAVWQERHWPVPLPPVASISDARTSAFLFHAGGLPCLVENGPPRGIRILLALDWPPKAGAAKSTPGLRARRAALAEAGFRVVFRRGGIEATAHGHLGAMSLKRPEALSLVVPVVFELRRIAALLGAVSGPAEAGFGSG